jgi:membrane protein YqaA with SNARE-associated domain
MFDITRWLYLVAAAPVRRPTTMLSLLRHIGGIGLVPLAILDASIVPTFGSLDLFTAYLSARTPAFWYYYALMSTIGAVIGAWLMYRLGKKMGEAWMEKKIGHKRFKRVGDAIHHRGFGAIFVSCIAPPPFPTSWFFVGAGAFAIGQKKFLAAVLSGRALRYGLLTWVAARYGRHFLQVLRHPWHYVVISLIISASLIAGVYLFSGKLTGKAESATADQRG